ncbi:MULTISPECIES: hypothetical protein [unclassified Bradyrhizobium]|uniref:hypothetical protein n=1 Tax=unclassified Bradyrhizobium TaxID=2631580 RepID=UPI0029167319|nr:MULTISPECIES: hypothetical protein [unclassified Bradyrhizobium]
MISEKAKHNFGVEANTESWQADEGFKLDAGQTISQPLLPLAQLVQFDIKLSTERY